ncbi:MAG: ATP synthase F1 subunit delta [Clostridiales bacterium]|nr:ATP synthase F1 subunit delta [Clostridiales bacterium]
MAKLVDKTYGDALFELALENQNIDTYFEESKAVLQILKENDELLKLLQHPKIVKSEKEHIIENIFKGRISEDMTGFLVLMLKKERQAFLIQTLEYFVNKVKGYKKIGIAYVTTAVELSEAKKKEVELKLIATTEYVEFEMNYNVDKSIIGGMIIRIGDRVVDSSISTKISNISKDLYNIQLA